MADAKRTCSVPDCERPYRARGLCDMHYQRAKSAGDLPTEWVRPSSRVPLENRFWARLERRGPDECWPWQGAPDASGYGVINNGRMPEHAHRVAFRLAGGETPPGMQVDHICRNRICVNPAHLRLVTHKQNAENRTVRHDSGTGIRNVFWSERDKLYYVSVKLNRKSHYGGSFTDVAEAEAAAIELRQRLFTHSPD